MRDKLKHTSKLYQFLEQKGVLANGTDAEIKAAKKEYRRLYQASWRKHNRAANTELTITLNHRELQTINHASRKHHRAKSLFLKEAAIAYITKAFVVPDILTANTILEYLTLVYTELQKLFDENILPYQIGKDVLHRITSLETGIINALYKPQLLEDRILEEIQKNPKYKDTLHQLLQKLDK